MDHGASKESFCRRREFLSSKMDVSGVWSNLVSGTSVSRDKKAPPDSSDAQLVGTLSSRNGINLHRSFESSILEYSIANRDTVRSQQS
jgi:hypothetical protein